MDKKENIIGVIKMFDLSSFVMGVGIGMIISGTILKLLDHLGYSKIVRD